MLGVPPSSRSVKTWVYLDIKSPLQYLPMQILIDIKHSTTSRRIRCLIQQEFLLHNKQTWTTNTTNHFMWWEEKSITIIICIDWGVVHERCFMRTSSCTIPANKCSFFMNQFIDGRHWCYQACHITDMIESHNTKRSILILAKILYKLFCIQSTICFHTYLNKVNICFTPRKNVTMMFKGSNEHNGTSGILFDWFDSTTSWLSNISCPRTSITICVSTLMKTKISRIVETKRTTRKFALEKLEII